MNISIVHRLIFIFIAFLLAYYLQGEMINTALGNIKKVTTYSTPLIFALVLGTFLYVIFNLEYLLNQPIIFKVISVYFLTTYIISVIHLLGETSITRNLYGAIILPLMLFWFFYIYASKFNDLNFIIIVMSVVTLFLIYFYFKAYSTRLLFFRNKESVTNASYFLLYILPILLLSKNKLFKIVSIAIITSIVFISFKRTGTIAVLLAIIAYIYINWKIKISGKEGNILLLVFGVSLVITTIILIFWGNIFDLMKDNYLFSRFENISEDQGSGRLYVWEITFKMIEESNVVQIIFGHGYNKVVSDSPLKLSAHNDFLEVLYDFGLIVFVIYLTIYVQLVKYLKQLIQQKSEYAAPMAVSVVLFFAGSLASHIIIYHYHALMFTAFWGFIISKEQNKHDKKQCNLGKSRVIF